MKKRNLLLVILAVLLVFGMVVGCGPAEEEEDAVEVTFSTLTASGSSTTTTSSLSLTFSGAITGLSANDITISGVAGVTKGALSGSAGTYSLAITLTTADGNLTVAVSKKGYKITPPSRTVAVILSDSAKSDLVAAKAATYFNSGFQATYKETAQSTSNTLESIKFDKNKLVIWDNTVGTLNYLNFTITKWEDYTVPTWNDTAPDQVVKSNYTIGFKLTGTIKNAYPTKTTAPTNVYGSKTAPGFASSDFDTTPAVIFIYLGGGGDDDLIDLTLIRSIITKVSDTTTTDKDAPIRGSDGSNTIRFYPEKDVVDAYPTLPSGN